MDESGDLMRVVECVGRKSQYECYATVKDSPHPHASLTLGLLNTNLELSKNGT